MNNSFKLKRREAFVNAGEAEKLVDHIIALYISDVAAENSDNVCNMGFDIVDEEQVAAACHLCVVNLQKISQNDYSLGFLAHKRREAQL